MMGREERFVCPRCGNDDARYIGRKNGAKYCRLCVSFIGAKAEKLASTSQSHILRLDYALSHEQKRISELIVKNFSNGIDTLVYAVCGAGKTELTFSTILYALSAGQQVGFAIPRRDVAIELADRLRAAFPKSRVTAVYGEHTANLQGDIIVLTTHQLYRYEDYFDLLVMDEVDAFPFKGDSVLRAFYEKSIRGHVVIMSATPSEEAFEEFKGPRKSILELRTRFHQKPIPVPKVLTAPKFAYILILIRLLLRFAKNSKPVLVFVPSIEAAERLYGKIRFFVNGGMVVHSKRHDREETITRFREGKHSFLVTTSVLERGVTIQSLQVIVLYADAEWVYDKATLIQISGRVGRKMSDPTGEVLFVAERRTQAMEGAIKEIKESNGFLHSVPKGV